ncbi:alpha-D-ribose 1-methylphosphonate 5-phosphate C-P lyase [Pullulanibacillus pueri]|uniref:DUF1659 domain-containing protein n=1 Tax=Pullulanibacillus pueri TaxID=1437324 RepID=A0A8J3EPE9_9BACL|nr:DUF1659 domain-containing protein [Pullulanibacillus pueri]MBM7680566.1 alpha-D-ribose 1-methylphosphonate 5-phosphate C-P lyase [Pullulanibacillus pueri]GGH88695.1 hypothetical protein GCM10007096_41610 [Pullulanibacillus pueri]
MATSQMEKTTLALVFDGGADEKGNAVNKRKSFNNVKTDATADQLYAIAEAIAGVQQYPLILVERNDTSEILN